MKRIIEIDLVKGFAIILAVIGHAFPDAVKGFWIAGQNSIASSLYYFIYSFHMPLFFMCSGFLLFPKLIVKENLESQIKSRFKRLMIPYLFLSFIYLGGKMMDDVLADNALSDNPVLGIIFGNSPCFGAWFLWSLFFVSVIVLSLRKVNIWLLFVLFLAITYIPLHLDANFKGVTSIMSNTMWLLMGCIVRKYYNYISMYLNKYVMLSSFMVILLIHIYADYITFQNVIFTRSVTIIKTLMGIVAAYSLCYILALKYKESIISQMLQTCGNYCMDIYIISMFVLVPLRILYVNVGLMNFIPYYLWVVIASILGTILPVIISKYIVRKVDLLRTLLVGE